MVAHWKLSGSSLGALRELVAVAGIKGNYQFFEMDQNRLGAVVNHLNQAGIGEHIYFVLCGRMTPDQKQIVSRRVVVDT